MRPGMGGTGGSRLVSVAAPPKRRLCPRPGQPPPQAQGGGHSARSTSGPHPLRGSWPPAQPPRHLGDPAGDRLLPHPSPQGVLDTGLPRLKTGSHLPAPGPHRLELGPPPAVCPLTIGQPGASLGPLEGPHRGAPPRASTPRAGSRQGAEGEGVSPRVNPREALAGCSQTPTGAQVGLWTAFYPTLADGDHPPGLRVPEPAALLWACVAIWW